jgi:hypothetical protein
MESRVWVSAPKTLHLKLWKKEEAYHQRRQSKGEEAFCRLGHCI